MSRGACIKAARFGIDCTNKNVASVCVCVCVCVCMRAPSAPGCRSFVKFPFHRFRANVPRKVKVLSRPSGQTWKTFDFRRSSASLLIPMPLFSNTPILPTNDRWKTHFYLIDEESVETKRESFLPLVYFPPFYLSSSFEVSLVTAILCPVISLLSSNIVKVLGCPKSVFLSQTCFLQQCVFIQTWKQVCEMSRCLSRQNKPDRT